MNNTSDKRAAELPSGRQMHKLGMMALDLLGYTPKTKGEASALIEALDAGESGAASVVGQRTTTTAPAGGDGSVTTVTLTFAEGAQLAVDYFKSEGAVAVRAWGDIEAESLAAALVSAGTDLRVQMARRASAPNLPCPNCGDADGARHDEERGAYFCFACGKSGATGNVYAFDIPL